MKPAPAHSNERGFALLIVFLLAAAVALMLYRQMPRVAFETERDKEQRLEDHGQEYVRAIQLYYVQFKKYPSKIEDLENTNDKRFLRRRFIDPMTGKDEWRLIHVNGVGQLTDSLVQKPPTPAGSTNDPNNALGFNPGTPTGASSGTDPNAPQQVNAAVARRPSDRPINTPGSFGTPPSNVDPNDPRYWPPTSIYPTAAINPATGQPYPPGQGPAQPLPGQTYPTYPGQTYPGQTYPGQAPGSVQPIAGQPPMAPIPGLPFPGQSPFPGQQPFPGQAPLPGSNPLPLPGQSGQLPGAFQPPLPGQTGFPGQPPGTTSFQNAGNGQPVPGGIMPTGGVYQPGTQPGTQPGLGGINGAPASATLSPTQAIQQQLMGASQPGQLNNSPQAGAGGIVGVASTFKGPSIKIYNDRQKYQEWEFIFDLKQLIPGQQPGARQANRDPLNPNNQNTSPFGNNINTNTNTNGQQPGPGTQPPIAIKQ